ESRAARESAPLIPQADVDEMRSQLERVGPQVRAGDPAGFNALERRFHGLFVENCPNAILRGFLAKLEDHLQRIRNVYPAELAAHKVDELEEHGRILDAIEARDPDALERAVREHLEGFTRRLLADLADQFAPASPP